MKRIGILGLGGVGGFIGAHLAQLQSIETVFLCRGATKEYIKNNGLKLIKGDGSSIIVQPSLVSDDPFEVGHLDVIIIATKAFDLIEAITPYLPCLNEQSVVIPIQNGINAKEELLQNIKTSATILDAIIYVSAHIKERGVIEHIGGGKIIYGNENNNDFGWIAEILNDAGIKTIYTHDIKKAVWKKFLFLSPFAVMTTAYKIDCGTIAHDADYRSTFIELTNELQQLAIATNVNIDDCDMEETIHLLDTFAKDATSSMELDFRHHAPKTEKAYLVDYVISSGLAFNVDVEVYQEMNQLIIEAYTTH